MTKYRIKVTKDYAGIINYIPQCRILGMWFDCTPKSISHTNIFNNISDAEDLIEHYRQREHKFKSEYYIKVD